VPSVYSTGSPAESLSSEPLSAVLTASIMASEVTVAPDTVSTSVELFSTIAAGTSSMAGSDKPSVSSCSVTSTFVITPSSTVTSTVNGPLWPSTVAVCVPSSKSPASTSSSSVSVSSESSVSSSLTSPSPLKAFTTASLIPVEVYVAPETTSTSVELLSIISAGISSKAGSETPSVSLWSRTVISTISPPSTVTSTSIGPPKPSPVPTNVPSSSSAGTSSPVVE